MPWKLEEIDTFGLTSEQEPESVKQMIIGPFQVINVKLDKPPGNFWGKKRLKRIKQAVEYVASDHAGIKAHHR